MALQQLRLRRDRQGINHLSDPKITSLYIHFCDPSMKGAREGRFARHSKVVTDKLLNNLHTIIK